MCTEVIIEEMTAETNQDLSLVHLVFDCVHPDQNGVLKQQPDILKFCLFVWLLGCLYCLWAARQQTVHPFLCFVGTSCSEQPNQ